MPSRAQLQGRSQIDLTSQDHTSFGWRNSSLHFRAVSDGEPPDRLPPCANERTARGAPPGQSTSAFDRNARERPSEALCPARAWGGRTTRAKDARCGLLTSSLVIPWFTLEPWTVRLPWGYGDVLIGPFEVSVVMALIIGLAVANVFARTHGRSVALTMDLAFYLVLFSFPTSWLLNGIFYEPQLFKYLLQHPSEILEVRLGWSMYGGIAGALIGAWVWKWRTGESILSVGESAAFAGPFGWSIARIGCFVTHDHPGRVSDFPLAVADYRAGVPPYEPRHDLGLYDSLVLFAIATLFFVLAKKQRPDGFYVAALALLYCPFRFGLDFLRASTSEGGDVRYAALTPGQYASLVLFVVGLILMRRVRAGTRQTPVSER